MTDRMKIWFLLVFLLGGLLGFFAATQTPFATILSPAREVKTPLSEGAVAMTVVARKDATNPLYKTSIEYPQFGGEEGLNGTIQDAVNKKLEEFQRNAAENWKARVDTTLPGEPRPTMPSPAPFYFSQTWQPRQINARVASFLIRFNSFSGGANETQEMQAFNYDFATHRVIALSDLFPGVANYLSQIARTVRENLAGTLNADRDPDFPTDMLNAGTEAKLENFQNFIFDDDVVEFYFPKYQVAPGSYGEEHAGVVRRAITAQAPK